MMKKAFLIILAAMSLNFSVAQTLQTIQLDLKVFLEGAYSNGYMSNALNMLGYLPLNQPYNIPPWNYGGIEYLTEIPTEAVVDWILIELHDATNANSFDETTLLEKRALLLNDNGQVTALDGVSFPVFDVTVLNNLFVIIRHRNHIDVVSTTPLTSKNNISNHNFTNSNFKVLDSFNTQKMLSSGIWGMVAGDANADNQIDNQDKNDVWLLQQNSLGYLSGDFNLDGQVNIQDKNDFWASNTGQTATSSQTFYLNLLIEPPGAGIVTGSGHYKAGDWVIINATANTGWFFVNWTDVYGNVSELANFIYTMPAYNVALTANFEMIEYTLSIFADPVIGGTATGNGTYNFGDQVQLQATPFPDWDFVKWTDIDGIVSVASSFIYTMPANNVFLTAHFEESIWGIGEPCPGTQTVTDFDGNIYNTVQIGGQCWMKENLRVGIMIDGSQDQTNNGIIEKYCYWNNPDLCNTRGGLYQWNEMMGYSTTPGAQGICPPGWHIPTDDEWKILQGRVDSLYGIGDPIWDQVGYSGYDVGKNLKTVDGWGGGGTDLYGFGAQPGGFRHTSFTFRWQHGGNIGYWWSSSDYSEQAAWMRDLTYYAPVFHQIKRNGENKVLGYSVRCLKGN